jgi:beta-mannosidase
MVIDNPGRALDDVQEAAFRASALRGDRWVDGDAALPVQPVTLHGTPRAASAPPPRRIDLDGEWRVKSCPAEKHLKDFDLNSWMLKSWGSEGLTQKWFREDTDRGDWLTLRVPGTIQSSMIEAGLLADPFWNTNTYDELIEHGEPRDVPWHFRKTRIEQSEWWYAKEFTLEASDLTRAWTLAFDGVDYSASFYINGTPLGSSAGMFGGPEYDVSRLLRAGSNQLVVRVFPPPPTWYGILKGNPGWGWHYGHLISVGLWQSVGIVETPPVRLADPFASTAAFAGDGAAATVAVQFDVVSALAAISDHEMSITVTEPDGTILGGVATIAASHGTSRFRAEIEVPRAKAWWPAGFGEQPLYRVDVAFADGSSPSVGADFGIRTIEMAQQAGPVSDDVYRWQFVVNGVPLFIKGTNWCWTDPTNGPRRSARVFLDAAADAGIQMLRAWGGGIVESEEFYELCDRMGILVYQEFPYSWGPPDGPDTDLGVLDDQVRRVVIARRNHPSLIMWGGGNENEAPFGADEGLFLVGRRCRQYDPSRPYHRTDPWGGSAHNYRVFHHGEPMASGYRSIESVFYGEFGLPSMPNRRSTERMIAADELDHFPPTPEDHGVIAHMHQFALFDFIKGLRYQHYGPITSWDDYIEYSQMAQGDGLRYAAERQRAGAVDGTKTGFWFYKLTELFPGHSWGILDFWGVRKDSYYRAKQFCRARALFATYDEFDWAAGSVFRADVFAANDTTAAWSAGTVVAELYDASLQVITSAEFTVDVDANRTVRLGEITAEVAAGREPMLLSVRRADGDDSSDSWYWFNFMATTPETRRIQDTPVIDFHVLDDDTVAPLLRAYAAPTRAPLRELARTSLAVHREGNLVRIRNSGEVPAINIHVRGREIDVDVDDSGFALVPGAVRTVSVQNATAADVDVTSWNADLEEDA